MATQTILYLQNQAAPYTPATLRGAWDATASAVTRYLGKAPSGAATSIGIAELNANTAWDVLLGRFISDPVTHDQTLSGGYILEAGFLESNAAANIFAHIHVYVTQGDSDTPRGTILTDIIDDVEFPTSVVGRLITGTITPLAIVKGDRIVVEIGYRSTEASATSRTGTLRYGGTAAVDVEYGDGTGSVTTRPGWFLVEGDLFAAERAKRQQPRLNRAHPLAKGLIVDLPMFEGGGQRIRNTVNNQFAVLAQDFNWEQGPPKGGNSVRSFGNAVGVMPQRWFSKFQNHTTIAFRIRVMRQMANDGAFLDNQWGGGHGGLQAYIGAGTQDMFIRGGSTAVDNGTIGNFDLGLQVWNTIIWTQEWTNGAGTHRLFADGREDDQLAMTVQADPPTSDIYFLCASGNQSQVQVELAEIRFWNRVLTRSEIKNYTKNSRGLYLPRKRTLSKVGTPAASYNQTINETITITDTISKNPSKRINEAIVVTDSVNKSLSRGLNEVVRVVDTISKLPARSLFERVRVYDDQEFYKDDFGHDLGDWNVWGASNISIANGKVTMTSGVTGQYYGMELPAVDMTNKSVQMEVLNAGNTAITSWELYPVQLLTVDQQNKLEFGINTNIYGRKYVAGSPTNLFSITYNPLVHKHFRIRIFQGTSYWDTSADGETWTNHYSEPTPIPVTALLRGVLIGTWQAEVLTTAAEFDNYKIFNLERKMLVSVSRSFSEVVTIVAAITKALSRSLSDTVTVVDTITKNPGKVLTEQVTIVDSITKAVSRSFNDTITVVASIAKAISRSLTEALTIQDSQTKSVTRNINETVTVQDSLSKNVSRNINETVTVVDSVKKDTTRNINEQITVVDTITRAISRSFFDSLTIIDSFAGRLPQRLGSSITALTQRMRSRSLKQKNNTGILKQKK